MHSSHHRTQSRVTSHKKRQTWSVVSLDGGLGRYASDWDRLNEKLHKAHPYFQSAFVDPLLAHFSSGREHMCACLNDNEVEGLAIVRPARAGKWSLFIPSQAQIVPMLLPQSTLLGGLTKALPGLCLGLDLPCQDPLYTPLSRGSPRGIYGPVPHAHTMGIKLDRTFEEYWAGRSGKLRNSVTRRLRRTADAGFALRLDRLTDVGQMKSAIARFGDMETAGWKGRAGTAIHASNVQGRFYADVMERFALRGGAIVYELFFNDVPAAMQLCIASKSMMVLLKTTYAENLAALSPGRLLLYLLVKQEFDARQFDTIEFYTNADSDQLAWATHDRWINHYLLFSNPLLSAVYRRFRSLAQAQPWPKRWARNIPTEEDDAAPGIG